MGVPSLPLCFAAIEVLKNITSGAAYRNQPTRETNGLLANFAFLRVSHSHALGEPTLRGECPVKVLGMTHP